MPEARSWQACPGAASALAERGYPTLPYPSRAGARPQVHPAGLRHIRADRRINEWRAPGRRTISRSTTNGRQVRHAPPQGLLRVVDDLGRRAADAMEAGRVAVLLVWLLAAAWPPIRWFRPTLQVCFSGPWMRGMRSGSHASSAEQSNQWGTLVVCNPDQTLWDPGPTAALQGPQVSQAVVALSGGEHTHQLPGAEGWCLTLC